MKAFHNGGIALALDVCQRATNRRLKVPAGMAIGIGRTYILKCRWALSLARTPTSLRLPEGLGEESALAPSDSLMASTLSDQKIAHNANFYVAHWRRIPRRP